MNSLPLRACCSTAIVCLSVTETLAQPNPWTTPSAPRRHVEQIADNAKAYEITMEGTLDEFNTAYYPETYGGSMRIESKFQPNLFVILENMGDADLVNPHLVVNGRRDWFSADDILAGILKPGMTDAEKAMAVWRFCASYEVQAHDNNRRVGPAYPAVGIETANDEMSHPSRNTFKERANPVKAVNCYYCSGCSLSAANFVILCRHAGLIARAPWMSSLNTFRNHCVGEVWYDGDWHLFDPERRTFFLEPDNATVASYEDLHNHPDWESRTHNAGFASKGMKPHAGEYKKYFPPHLMPVEQWLSTMAMTLRPGETFVWRWTHDGKYRYGANVRKKSDLVPYHLANGKLIYRPRFDGDVYLRGIVSDHNMARTPEDGNDVMLHPQVVIAPGDDKDPIVSPRAFVIYKVSSPYPIVGGIIGARFFRKTDKDACRLCVSVHDSDWRQVHSADKTGEFEAYVAVDDVMNPEATPAIYEYYVKIDLQAYAAPTDACLLSAYIETDVQMADTALPALSVGVNSVVYRDASGPERRARITHAWRESSATQPPQPPGEPASPADGTEVDLTSLKMLAWQPASDPDGQGIADYHVQVSPRQDMLHPVSPNLDRLTASGKPEWPLPQGWLAKGHTYYWRVRAKDSWGAWSGWSPVWRFTAAP
ncbi:MAG: hypothetical protein JXQ73_25300 [Phycisphaerae bacterium]|nr:hypothetical protein [Phycisphaerae bacterium]